MESPSASDWQLAVAFGWSGIGREGAELLLQCPNSLVRCACLLLRRACLLLC